jgi:hypothetical protein
MSVGVGGQKINQGVIDYSWRKNAREKMQKEAEDYGYGVRG